LTDDAGLWAVFGTHELWQIIGVSLAVSLAATVAATMIELPTGVALAIGRFRGRHPPALIRKATREVGIAISAAA
jgi:ABC-type spermidine/putrescine transport system permease subunit II